MPEGTTPAADVAAPAPTTVPGTAEAPKPAPAETVADEQTRSRKTRKALLAELGVATDDDLSALVNAGRTAMAAAADAEAAKTDPSVRLKEQLHELKGKHAAEVAALQAERDAAVVRDAIRSEVAALKLMDGADRIIMAELGVAPREVVAAVENGKPVLRDADGDPIKGDLAGWIKAYAKDHQHLIRGTAGALAPHAESNPAARQNATENRPRGERAVLKYINDAMKQHGGKGNG